MSPRISSIKAETCRRKTLIDSAFFVREALMFEATFIGQC
jgi:hypothetical protein